MNSQRFACFIFATKWKRTCASGSGVTHRNKISLFLDIRPHWWETFCFGTAEPNDTGTNSLQCHGQKANLQKPFCTLPFCSELAENSYLQWLHSTFFFKKTIFSLCLTPEIHVSSGLSRELMVNTEVLKCFQEVPGTTSELHSVSAPDELVRPGDGAERSAENKTCNAGMWGHTQCLSLRCPRSRRPTHLGIEQQIHYSVLVFFSRDEIHFHWQGFTSTPTKFLHLAFIQRFDVSINRQS